MVRVIAAVAVCLVAFLAVQPVEASLIVFGMQSGSAPVPGGSLSDVRMQVDLAVSGGIATMTFTNVSAGAETSAVFKEIVVDTYDDDAGTYVLWGAQVVSGAYTVDDGPNGLPGYGPVTRDGVPLASLMAWSSPVKNGIGPGGSLVVQFNTALPDGASISDYLSFFGGGSDTSHASLGFHAISSSVAGGESLSGIATTPEPTLTALLLAGAGLLLRRRKTA